MNKVIEINERANIFLAEISELSNNISFSQDEVLPIS